MHFSHKVREEGRKGRRAGASTGRSSWACCVVHALVGDSGPRGPWRLAIRSHVGGPGASSL